jgi:heme o synthase
MSRSLAVTAPATAPWRRALVLVRAYGTLLKPKITLLLAAVAVTAAVVAAATTGSTVSAGQLALLALLGTAAAGGAATLNHLFDRDLDARMGRTRHRPIPSGLVSPQAAAAVAIILLSASLPLAALLLGVVPAFFCALGAGIYGCLYTLVLKRRTPHNIEIGGLAGSCGALAGWALVDPALGPGGWALAALVFLWTPAHFWGLAIVRDADYRVVGVPMMPQIAGVATTSRRMTVYALLTMVVSLALVPLTSLGLGYGVVAALSGGLYTALCLRCWRTPTPRAAFDVFKASGAYLGVLLLAMLAPWGA